MAGNTKIAELRNRSDEDLVAELKSLNDELFKLKFQHATGQLEKTHRLPTLKRTIARVHTLIKERAAATKA